MFWERLTPSMPSVVSVGGQDPSPCWVPVKWYTLALAATGMSILPSGSVWISEASSYNTVHRLPDGRWLAFLRGTSTIPRDPPKLGFASSNDGRNWNYFNENPIIHQNDGGGRNGVYRPAFIGYLGNDEYLLAWHESVHFDGDARLIYGYTRGFKTVRRDKRGYVKWKGTDGPISAWREGDRLYLFAGKFVHEMELPVR